MSKKITQEEFLRRSIERHGEKYDYSKAVYEGKEKLITIICHKHGEFRQRASSHWLYGCEKCSYEERGEKCRKSKEQFVIDSRKVHGNKYDYSKFEYVNARTKGMIICPIHGEFLMTPNMHLTKREGCPYCKQSKLELEVETLLKGKGVEFEMQKRFDWLGKMSLDFYLPKYSMAIECQGKQHFGIGNWGRETDSIHERDMRKRELCNENNVKMLYFTDLNEIKEDECYVGTQYALTVDDLWGMIQN
jgi:very-short-patch-repair endonuclease